MNGVRRIIIVEMQFNECYMLRNFYCRYILYHETELDRKVCCSKLKVFYIENSLW